MNTKSFDALVKYLDVLEDSIDGVRRELAELKARSTERGLTGEKGARGEQGPQGEPSTVPGPPGPAGKDGADGKSLTVFAGGKVPTNPSVGDLWIVD